MFDFPGTKSTRGTVPQKDRQVVENFQWDFDLILYLSSQRLYLDDQLRSIDELSSPWSGVSNAFMFNHIWDPDPQIANEQLNMFFPSETSKQFQAISHSIYIYTYIYIYRYINTYYYIHIKICIQVSSRLLFLIIIGYCDISLFRSCGRCALKRLIPRLAGGWNGYV